MGVIPRVLNEISHDERSTLAHNLNITMFKELLRDHLGRINSVIIWTDSAKTRKVREVIILRDLTDAILSVTRKAYDRNGLLVETLTSTFSRLPTLRVGSVSVSHSYESRSTDFTASANDAFNLRTLTQSISSSHSSSSVVAAAVDWVVSASAGAQMGTGTSYAPLHVSVTGGGAMPSLSGAPVAPDCAGLSETDTKNALQTAITNAAAQGKPLVIPGNRQYAYNAPLEVTTSLIWDGQGAMPRFKQNSTSGSWQSGSGIILRPNFSGWVYGLHLVGNFDKATSGEWAHNISVRAVNGVTIKNCKMESTRGDAISDNATDADSTPARNVLVDGNTLDARWRCCASFTGKSSGWAFVNNVFRYVDSTYQAEAWVNGSSAIDLEPEGGYDAFIEDVEISYNRFIYDAIAASFVPVVQATAWFDTTPGRNIFVHHNYGTWNRPDFFESFSYQGQGATFFQNVQEYSNAQGANVP